MVAEPRTLTLRPDPIEGESRSGYLLRSLTINGRWLSRKTIAKYGLRMSPILVGKDGDVVRRVTGVDVGILDAHTVHGVTSRQVHLRGQVLHRDDFTTENRRWCPACWASDLARPRDDRRPVSWNLHRRAWWDIAALTTCPTHSVRLSSRCKVCAKGISWRTGSLTRCSCEANLLRVEAEPINAEATQADAYVLSRLGYGSMVPVPFLDGLRLDEALDAMQQLGSTKLGGALGALSKFAPERHGEILSEGFRVAQGWPTAFDAVLDGLAARAGLGHWGAEKLYGYLYIWVKALRGGSGDDARARLAEHYASNSFVRRDSIVARLADADLISLADLAKRTCRSQALVRSALEHFGFAPAATKRGTPITISPSQAVIVAEFFEDSLEQNQLFPLMGISLNSLKRLIAAGVLEKSDLRSSDVLKKSQFFSRKKVTALMAGLLGSAPLLDEIPPGCEPLMSVSQTSGLGSLDVIIGLIRSGTLAVEGVLPPRNIGAIVIRDSAVDEARRVVFHEAMTIEDAAKAYGLHPGSLTAAIDAGLIVATTGHAGRPRVTQQAFDRFRERYTTTGWLNAVSALGNRRINAALNRAGVWAVVSPSTDDRCKTSIWDRTQVPAEFLTHSVTKTPSVPVDGPDSSLEVETAHQITDAEWEEIAPLIEQFATLGGKKRQTNRRFIGAIRWLLRHGGPWKRLPSSFGPHSTAYSRHKRWLETGVWARLAGALSGDPRHAWMQDAGTLVKGVMI